MTGPMWGESTALIPHKGPVMRRAIACHDVIVYGLVKTYSEVKGGVFNSSPAGQNDRHFAGDTFICVFVNENACIMIKISTTSVPQSLVTDMRRLFIQRGHRRSLPILTQSLVTDMRRLFYSTWPPSFSSHIKKGEESDDGHRIKRALYVGIKRLWSVPKGPIDNNSALV